MSVQNTINDHAIVIGASMAGLLAARVLVDHFGKVTLLERDQLPDIPEPRRGFLKLDMPMQCFQEAFKS